MVLTWRITASGSVESARVRTTTMRNGKVEDCIVRQIQGLHFPQRCRIELTALGMRHGLAAAGAGMEPGLAVGRRRGGLSGRLLLSC